MTTPMDVDDMDSNQEMNISKWSVQNDEKKKISKTNPIAPDWKDLPSDVVIIILDFTVMPLHRFLKTIFFSVPAANHQQTMLAYNTNVNTSVGPGLKVQHQYQPGNMAVPVQPHGMNTVRMAQAFSSNFNAAGGTFGRGSQMDRNVGFMVESTRLLIRELYGVFKESTTAIATAAREDGETNSEEQEKGNDKVVRNESNVESESVGRKRTRSMAGMADNEEKDRISTPKESRRTKQRGGNPIFLWKNIDLEIVSNYFQDHEPLSVDQVQVLCHNLVGCRYINFRGHCNFDDDCMETLVTRNPDLEFVDVRVTELDYNGLRFMMKHGGGQYVKHLKTLKLSWCSRTQLTDTNLHTLGFAKKLTHLEIINNGLRSSGVETLLQHCKGLTCLNLSHNPIEDSSCKYLAKSIHLKKLVLRDCEITNVGAHTLICNDSDPFVAAILTDEDMVAAGLNESNVLEINALHQSPGRYRLQSLDLSNNTRITDHGISNIGTNTTLLQLQLNDTGISDSSVAKYLSKSTTLRSVSLDYTRITTGGLESMIVGSGGEEGSQSLVQNMPQLKEVSLRNSRVTKDIFSILEKRFGRDHRWDFRIYLT